MNNKILFQEKQKFTQWWLWLILLVPLGFTLYKAISCSIDQSITSNSNFSISFLMLYDFWIVLLISTLILVFMLIVTLETTIDSEKISVKHLLFVKKRFKWEDIKSAEIVKYGFVGYGIRISLNHGTVYNVKGNQGLFLKLKKW